MIPCVVNSHPNVSKPSGIVSSDVVGGGWIYTWGGSRTN